MAQTITTEQLYFLCGPDPAQWPKLTCTQPGHLGLQDAGLRLPDNRAILFEGNGQIRALDDTHRLVFDRAGGLLELHEAGAIRLLTGSPTPTERLRILATGQVGIGTATPTSLLHVTGDIRTDGALRVAGQAAVGGTLTVGSHVGIGTQTPTLPLQVVGTVEATAFQGSSAYFGELSVKTNAWVGSLTVGSNVGIGTQTPTQPLEVVGTVKATAFEGRLAYLTGLSVEGNADVAGRLTVRRNVDIGGDGGDTGSGVYASWTSTGVWGVGDTGILAEGRTLGILSFVTSGEQAGEFYGNVFISGTLSGGGGRFKIDHPLDPANKYLSHSFVESPEMLNIYRGNITTDNRGEATIDLPDYFDALNRDFSYHLTVIGQMAQAAVTTEIHDNRFTVQTDRPGVTVSWLVIGVRHDPWANAHCIPVEEAKPQAERGFYLHPEIHAQPATRGIVYAQYPELLQRAAPNS
jgi:hypothetical protein